MTLDRKTASHFASMLHRVTHKSTSWLMRQDRNVDRYARQLRRRAEVRSEDAAQAIRDAWMSI